MALTDRSNDTLTTDGTEQTLTTQTTAGTYVLNVDLSNMADGNAVTVRIKNKILTGGSSTVAYIATFYHSQAEPSVFSIPVPVMHEITCTLELTAGSNINIPWTLMQLDG